MRNSRLILNERFADEDVISTESEYLCIRELRRKRVSIWKRAVLMYKRNPIGYLVQIVWHITS